MAGLLTRLFVTELCSRTGTMANSCSYFGLLVLATALVNQIQGQCPNARDFAPCTCDGQGFNCRRAVDHKELELSFQSFSDIPMARALYIQGTKVSKLTAGIFGKYAIKTLFLDINNITVVESGAFNGSENLAIVISLYSNNIEMFPFQDISQFRELETLNLGRNQLSSIPDKAFGPSNSLKEIYLSFNKISTIGIAAFEQLRALKTLDLLGNKISTLGPQSMAFTSPNIEQVSFDFNEVRGIDPLAFSNVLPKYLLINNNNITTLPEDSYFNLIARMAKQEGYFISLEGNPFSCTGCSYKWLLRNNDADNVLAGFKCKDGRHLTQLTSYNIKCV